MVLDSSQIVHGKLERADDALVRDVVDLIKANEHDPKALTTAVNCRRPCGGVIHCTAIAPGEIDRTLDECGVGHYLGASACGASRIREALHDACRTGIGRQKVWDSGTAPPAVTDRQPGRAQDPDR